MVRDAAGRRGSPRLRHGIIWWLRLMVVAALPTFIVAVISYGPLTALLVAGVLFSVFVALAVLGAWLDGAFAGYDR